VASHSPDTRLGRALKAGIPVALIMLGAEMIDGQWTISRSGSGVALSWSSSGDSDGAGPYVRVATCIGKGCGPSVIIVKMPQHHPAAGLLSFVRSATAFLTGDCPDRRVRRRSIVSA
jgi:hypothetical protein